ncbi:MAG: YgcG family protein [Pseudomonadota bacterium]|nr:MAG: YgcG family protein [Pseudomonadota bacterium]
MALCQTLVAGLTATVLFAANVSYAEVPVPPLSARVVDLTATLSAKQRQSLEGELAAFEQRKGAQIAVLLVPTTEPEAIEQFSIRVVDAWQLGRKGVDDGLLLLVAKNDRKMRIEVGRGLEGVVPDAIAKRVIAEVITPFFKNGDFYGGIEAGINRLIRIVDGEPLPPPREKDVSWSQLEDALWIGVFLVVMVGALLRTILGRLLGAAVTGGATGFVFWLIVGTLLGGVIAGVIAFVITLIISFSNGRGGGRSGGWSSSSGGGWSSGGGGFSGGGGSFGGGGASGSW